MPKNKSITPIAPTASIARDLVSSEDYVLPRYLQRQLSDIKYPQLVLLGGKHGDTIYFVPDEPTFWRTLVECVRVRVEEQEYIYPPEKIPSELEPQLSPEEIAKLPEKYQAKENAIAVRNHEIRNQHYEELLQWHLVRLALDHNNGRAAMQVLWDRRDAEYEAIELQDVNIVEKPTPLKSSSVKKNKKRK